jgi:hypothetical protein
MINLLPEESKKEIQAARVNVILLRYNLFTLIAFAGLTAICLLFYLILFSAQSNAETTSTVNTQEVAKYAEVEKNAETYKQNLAMAKIILDRGVNYTSFIMDLTRLLPSGVVLNGINLSAADIGKQVSFTSEAVSYAKAIELKDSFEASFYYTNVHFQNIADSSSAGNATAKYPITITMSVLVCDGVCPDKKAAFDKAEAEKKKAEEAKKSPSPSPTPSTTVSPSPSSTPPSSSDETDESGETE